MRFVAPQLVYELQTGGSALCVQMALLASQLSSGGLQLVTTGTLTASPDGQATYEETPVDRLRVVPGDGTAPIECAISAMEGDLSTDADTYLTNDHRLALRFAQVGTIDLQIASARLNGAMEAAVTGNFVYEGTSYTADIKRQGSVYSEGASEYVEEESRRGTIAGLNFALNAKETYRHKRVFVDNLVSNEVRTMNNRWTADGESFEFVDGVIKQSFVNGAPAELDSYWQASGTLLRNGQPFGQVAWGREGNQIKIWLETPSDRIELYVIGL
jgi:hypothetical protein